MRRRFFNAADNFVGGCYNKLSNEDIKRLGGNSYTYRTCIKRS